MQESRLGKSGQWGFDMFGLDSGGPVRYIFGWGGYAFIIQMSTPGTQPYKLFWFQVTDHPLALLCPNSYSFGYYFCLLDSQLPSGTFPQNQQLTPEKSLPSSQRSSPPVQDSLKPSIEPESCQISNERVAGNKSKKIKQIQLGKNSKKKLVSLNLKPSQSPQRNILPNILHQACCFVQIKKRSQHLAAKYFQLNPQTDSTSAMVSKFYSYQTLMKQKVNPYLNLQGLKMLNQLMEPSCEIFSIEEQTTFLRLTRIMIKYFLDHYLNQIVLTSIRMKGESRRWHFEWKRKISMELQNLFSDI